MSRLVWKGRLESSARGREPWADAASRALSTTRAISLQRTIGNRSTVRLLAREHGTASKDHRSVRQSDRARREDLDRALVAMGGSQYGPVVKQALSFADMAAISHERVRQAVLHGAGGTSDADRAFAAAVFVIAARNGDPLTAEAIERGELKVAAISETALRAIQPHARAGYVPGGRDSRSLRGRTLYIPSTFRLDSVAQQGTMVHELDHAATDLLFTDNPAEMQPADFELEGYMAEAAFYIETLRERNPAERTAALGELSQSAGPVLIRLMVAWALQAPGDEFDGERAIVEELNALTRAADPDAALSGGELAAAWRESPAANRQAAATAIDRRLRRERRTSLVPLGAPIRSDARRRLIQRFERAAGNQANAQLPHRQVPQVRVSTPRLPAPHQSTRTRQKRNGAS